jgi:hypothetical protein
MYLPSGLIVGLLFAGAKGVLGGSRLWEAKAPNKQTNASPYYPALETLNTTSVLVRRAFSIKSNPDDNRANRLWPNKKIRYCFEQRPANVAIRGLWQSAMDIWAELKDHGFSYEEVSDGECISQVSSVLRIHYNQVGRLSATLGIPPINEAANTADPNNAVFGPFVHLSDMLGVGQDDVNANVAHELGHVWGLLHEHQNMKYWSKGIEDNGWSIPKQSEDIVRFRAGDFNCQNLKDYNTIVDQVQPKIDKARADGESKKAEALESDLSRRCVSQPAALAIGFSAAEWIPYPNFVNVEWDNTFDEDSLMLYPSGSGGTGLSDNRAVIMTYKNGDHIPNRLTPSSMDIARLIALYGTPTSSTLGVTHNSKSSVFRNKLRSVRSKIFRAGDTSVGLC